MPQRGESVTYRMPSGRRRPAMVLADYEADFELRREGARVATAKQAVVDLVVLVDLAEDGDTLTPDQKAAGYVVCRAVFQGDAPHRWQHGQHDSLSARMDALRGAVKAAEGIRLDAERVRLEATERAMRLEAELEGAKARGDAAVAAEKEKARAEREVLAGERDAARAEREQLRAQLLEIEAELAKPDKPARE